MVAVGAPSLITGQWWAALFPGAVIGIIVLGFALVGDGIRAYLDPTTR
jgi:peptide/nickel transport system permease protein